MSRVLTKCYFINLLGGQARGAKGTRMQAYVFPRTSGARNPIVIVKIFIFIFLRLKLALQAKPCKGGRCNLEGWLINAIDTRSEILACHETGKG